MRRPRTQPGAKKNLPPSHDSFFSSGVYAAQSLMEEGEDEEEEIKDEDKEQISSRRFRY